MTPGLLRGFFRNEPLFAPVAQLTADSTGALAKKLIKGMLISRMGLYHRSCNRRGGIGLMRQYGRYSNGALRRERGQDILPFVGMLFNQLHFSQAQQVDYLRTLPFLQQLVFSESNPQLGHSFQAFIRKRGVEQKRLQQIYFLCMYLCSSCK